MRVMVLVKATEDSEKGFEATADMQESMEAMGRFNQELIDAGIMKAGDCDGLTPSSQGKRVAFNGLQRKVIDGPFAQPSELVAGYWFWEVKDMDEAIAWVKRCPNPMPVPSEIEIDRCTYQKISSSVLNNLYSKITCQSELVEDLVKRISLRQAQTDR